MKCFVLLALISFGEAAKILAYFPVPSISHHVVFRRLTQELVRRGHEVTVITTDPEYPEGKAPANLTEIDVHDMSYSIWQNIVPVFNGKKSELPNTIAGVFKTMNLIVEQQLQHKDVQHLIKHKRNYFDVLLLEQCIRPTVALTHVFKAPAILVSTFGDWIFSHDIVGSPIHPLLFPSTPQQRIHDLSLYEKIQQLYLFFRIQYQMKISEGNDIRMLRKHLGEDLPDFKELRNNIDMLFFNIHPIWENNRPVPPTVVYMGGIHQTLLKELPQDLKRYLDSSKNGVIYMSFGSNSKPSLLPAETIEKFVKVFSSLPYDVLWKWDSDDLPGISKNIKIQKWLPQSDLLRHPKIKLFITQGGLQSTDEALTAGVPLIGIPILADQWFNTDMYVKHGIGVKLDIETLTESDIKNAIYEILNNDSYRKNVVKLHDLMNDEPQKPLERATWWIEYVIRHKGAKHLRSPSANMPWHEYFELKLVGVVLLLLVFILILSVIVIKYLLYIARRYIKYDILVMNFANYIRNPKKKCA